MERTVLSVKVGSTTRMYGLWRTNASARYDWSTVIEIEKHAEGTSRFERLVLIEEGNTGQQQRDRYGSGLCACTPVETFEVSPLTVEQILWERVLCSDPS